MHACIVLFLFFTQIPKLYKWWDQHSLTWSLEEGRERGRKNGMLEHMCWIPGEKGAKMCPSHPVICPKEPPQASDWRRAWRAEMSRAGVDNSWTQLLRPHFEPWNPSSPVFYSSLPWGSPWSRLFMQMCLFCVMVPLSVPGLRCGEGGNIMTSAEGKHSSYWATQVTLGMKCFSIEACISSQENGIKKQNVGQCISWLWGVTASCPAQLTKGM